MTSSLGQAGDTAVPQIEVTAEMIEAGVKALRRYLAEDDLRQNDEAALLADVYRSMELWKLGSSLARSQSAKLESLTSSATAITSASD